MNYSLANFSNNTDLLIKFPFHKNSEYRFSNLVNEFYEWFYNIVTEA